MRQDFKVGDEVFIFDCNRIVYSEETPRSNFTYGKVIYRGHFVKDKIIGETSRSWLLGPEWKPVKVPKKRTYNGPRFYTEEEVNDACWIESNRLKLSRFIEGCNEVDMLRQIAKIVGFKESIEEALHP